MSPKRQILLRCTNKIAGNHESMDTGVEFGKYKLLAGQNQAYQDIYDFVTDDLVDEDEDELEGLPEL